MIKTLLTSSFLLFLLVGCSEKKEEKQAVETKPTVNKQADLKIEIEENADSKAIKVAQKTKTNDKNETYYFNYKDEAEPSSYDSKSMPANTDASVRVKPRTNIDANLHVRSPYDKVQVSMLVKRLSKEFIVKCSACHNDYANGVIGPSLLDKDAQFIFDNIKKFQNNKDANVLMSELVNQMKDEDIQRIADEIYQFNQEVRKLQ